MKESEIRPKAVFDEYLRLAKIDTEVYFSNSPNLIIRCPACNSEGKNVFNKNNFNYCQCDGCLTLFVNPRPHKESFANYYTNSPSSRYWATTFYKQTVNARREKIWKPKAILIANNLKMQNAIDYQIIDIGGGYGIFAEEIQKHVKQAVIIIEPSPNLAEVCIQKGFRVIHKFLENVSLDDIPEGPKSFVSFELFEHLHSPEQFLLNLNSLMHSNDLFIFTTLSGTGVDIQVLWENSPSVSPPHHLNFFNPHSIKIILERTGFSCIDVSTPGELDIDIMNNNKDNISDRFWRTFLELADEEQKLKLQNVITETGWSSHIMVVCKKI